MTITELDQKIRAIAPQWMIIEADYLIELAHLEGWGDIPETIMECWDYWDGQDWTKTNRYKQAVTKIERTIGMQKQLCQGETCLIASNRGNRNYTAGEWIFDKTWDELID